MPLTFPQPQPNEVTKSPVELYRWLRDTWRQLQKFRSGTFSWTPLVTGGTSTVVIADVTAGGAITGIDNLKVGMWVGLTPPATFVAAGLGIFSVSVSAPGSLSVTFQNFGAPVSPAGTWSYLAFQS